MLLRRSVVLVTTLAAALTVGGTTTAGAEPALPRVDLDSAAAEFQPLSKMAAQRAAVEQTEQLVGTGRAASARPRTDVATTGAAAEVSAAATSGGSAFTPVSPVRVLDTRSGIGVPAGAVPSAGSITLDLSARVPATATAVVLNVTGVTPTGGTYLTVWPSGEDRPVSSNINLRPGEVRSNAATVALGTGRSLDFYNNFGATHVVADLAGYYAPNTGSRFTATQPTRVLDTRTTSSPLGPGTTRTINLSGRVPATATAVTFNLTAAGSTRGGYITAWPAGTPRPSTSTLNMTVGQDTPNLVTVRLGTNRSVSLYNLSGHVHLIADLAGYYATDRGDPFYQVSPLRIVDTRYGDPLPGGWIGTVNAAPVLPASARAVVFNLTGTNVTAPYTFLTAFPAGGDVPTASNLNLLRGQTLANLVTVALPPDRRVDVYNRAGDIDFLMDVAGYFAPPPPACTTECVHSWGDNTGGLLGVGTTGGTSNRPGRVDGRSGFTSVTGGVLNGYGLRSDGTVWSWGLDDGAGLGTGQAWGMSTVPVQVSGLSGITQVSAGAFATYALNSLGQVYSWGYNINGAMGVGDTVAHRSPKRITGLSGVVQVAGSYDTGYALRNDGTVWVWGVNGGAFGNGQYGTGCGTVPVSPGCRALVPVQVPGLTGVVSIATTWNATFAVKADGSVWAWGYNGNGQVGLGTVGGPSCPDDLTGPNCMALAPTQIPGLTGVKKVASGGTTSSYALLDDGTVLAWGGNASGELGLGVPPDCAVYDDPSCARGTPTPVPGLTDVVDIVGGGAYALAQRSDGTVWAWGSNTYGQLGDDSDYQISPTQVAGLSGVRTVGTAGWTSYAIA